MEIAFRGNGETQLELIADEMRKVMNTTEDVALGFQAGFSSSRTPMDFWCSLWKSRDRGQANNPRQGISIKPLFRAEAEMIQWKSYS